MSERRSAMRTMLVVLVLAVSACGEPSQVACSGPLAVTCECAQSCSVSDAGTLETVRWEGEACVPSCWLRGGPAR